MSQGTSNCYRDDNSDDMSCCLYVQIDRQTSKFIGQFHTGFLELYSYQSYGHDSTITIVGAH